MILFHHRIHTMPSIAVDDVKSMLLRLGSIPLFYFIALQLIDFPVFTVPIIGLILLYAIGLSYCSKLWLIVLPALLPVLDLTPWSGRILVTEFDLFILTSIAISLLFNRLDFSFIKQLGIIKWFMLLLIVSYGISTYLGYSMELLQPLPFYIYLTEYNSLRVAKGFFAALIFLPILAYEKKQGTQNAKFLSLGILSGFVFAILSIIWERTVFPGFFDFSYAYRISGLFSGLLLGGEMLDGYLFLSFPFFIILFYCFNSPWLRFLGVFIFVGGLYSILVTFTRTNYLAVSVVIAILLLGSLKIHQVITKRKIFLYGIFILIALCIAIGIFKGGYIGQRFSTTKDSINERLEQWENAINISQKGIVPFIFGNGKGSYPNYYFSYEIKGLTMARFWLMDENQESKFLRFSPSDKDGTLNVSQRFPVNQIGTYKVKITLRSPSGYSQKLLVEFCNKNILRFQSECQWLGFSTQKNNQWQTITQDLVSDNFTKPLLSPITPVDINLLNRGLKENLDIGQVEIFDPNGKQLLKNTSFNEGFDHWFFYSGNHAAWHTDNLWVYAFFEGGLVELCLITFLLIYLINQLFKQTLQANYYALAMLAAIVGLIIVGLFGSMFDDPRVSWLFYLIVWLAILKPEMPPASNTKTTLMRSVIPFIVVSLMALGITVYVIKKSGYGVGEVSTIFLSKLETKLGTAYAQTYQAKLDFPDLYQWRGQGANPLYNAIISRYKVSGQPFSINESTEKTTLSRLIQVNNNQQLLQALANAEPGDGIELQIGIYSINQNIGIGKNATAEKPIVIYARQLGDVLIEFDTVEGFKVNASHWTFQNLIIKGDCESQSKCEHAFHITGKADGTILRNNIIYDFNAAIKGNGELQKDQSYLYPNNVLIEKNTFTNSSPRNTGNPVTTIDVVGGDNWRIKANLISDFIKLQSNKTSYAAFLKGYGKNGLFEENLVICNKKFYQPDHYQIGLSFGGGGTGSQFCFDKKCQYEHEYGIMQNNIIMNCNDVGIYINKGKDTQIINNILYNTAGIDVRFPESNAIVSNNLLTGKISQRGQEKLTETNNLQELDNEQFRHWFNDPDKADFSLLLNPSEPFPISKTIINTDYCSQPINSPTRKFGAVDSDSQALCKDVLSNALPAFSVQFNEKEHLVIKQQEKILHFYKEEQKLKSSVTICPIGCEYQDLNKALKAVKTHGFIYIEPGVYETCGVINRSVQIIGKRQQDNGVHLRQTACNGKAALVVNAPNVTLEDLEISKVSVDDKNGACLRLEANASNMTINKLNCHDNQAGIIANIETGKLTIKNSVFERNGFNHGKVSNISINSKGAVEFINSKVLSTTGEGHALQLNAPYMLIDHTEIAGLNELNSRAIDNSIGGELIISNSVLQQGPNSDNNELIGYALGNDKELLDKQIVVLKGNQFIFDKKGNLASYFLNSRKLFNSTDNTEVLSKDNIIVGMDKYGASHVTSSGDKIFTDRAAAGL